VNTLQKVMYNVKQVEQYLFKSLLDFQVFWLKYLVVFLSLST
jgi:hypothetical protein